MSYDVTVGERDLNTTFNHAPVFNALMPNGLKGLHGLNPHHAQKIINFGLLHVLPLKRDELRDKMKDVEWGSFDDAIKFLHDLFLACLLVVDPDETIGVFA
jgi:hypothetical protein